jgi:DNA helicase-2/ATP-dependent DNA helicase PcrA
MQIPPDCEDILEGLNEDQRRAVTHERGPLLILAGAGSGKTRVITRRIAWLVRARAVWPSRILAVTFTNKAAAEMRERVEVLLGGADAPKWMGTFHSIGLRLLRMNAERIGYPNSFVIYDDDDTESALRRVLKNMELPRDGLRAYSHYIDACKNDGLLEAPEPRTPRERQLADVFTAYQAELKAAGAMDFGDLLARSLRMLQQHADIREKLQSQYEYLLVDEFQDTNVAQYEFLKILAGTHRNLCVVGDDDQSIYSWRGARVDNILDFPKEYPEAVVVTLGRNYRSRTPILSAAARVIGFNRKRHAKDLAAMRGDGEPVRVHGALNEVLEAQYVVREMARRTAEGTPLSRMAIFYRTNAQSRVFEDALRSRRIAYKVVGGMKFYQRKEVKDVISWLRLLVNPLDRLGLERALNSPPRGIGATTLDKARARADQDQVELLHALATIGDQGGPALQRKVRTLIELITDLAMFARDARAGDVVQAVLDRTGYLQHLAADESAEGQSRVENVMELLSSVREFEQQSGQPDLRTWLDRVSLVQPLDDDGSGDAISLMTVHAAKGLEFDYVCVCGLEDGLFPLTNRQAKGRGFDAGLDRAAMEEERRLMYVAMTRARDGLYLTYASTRVRYGQLEAGRPSIFLSELPGGDVKVV